MDREVTAQLFIEWITKWTQCRVLLILLRNVLNLHHYHRYTAAHLPSPEGSWLSWRQRSTRKLTESSQMSMGTSPVIQLLHGRCCMMYQGSQQPGKSEKSGINLEFVRPGKNLEFQLDTWKIYKFNFHTLFNVTNCDSQNRKGSWTIIL